MHVGGGPGRAMETVAALTAVAEDLAVLHVGPIAADVVIAPDIRGGPNDCVAGKAWFDEAFPVELGCPAPAAGGAGA